MCVPSLGWTLNGRPICRLLFVDVKDPTVSFESYRQHCEEIPALTSRGHYISDTALPPANDATQQPCAAYERSDQIKCV